MREYNLLRGLTSPRPPAVTMSFTALLSSIKIPLEIRCGKPLLMHFEFFGSIFFFYRQGVVLIITVSGCW